MSWLLKQAEDMLNRVDQQTHAALRPHGSAASRSQNQVEFISETASIIPSVPTDQPKINQIPINRTVTMPIRRTKKDNEADLISYLNSSTPVNQIETKQSIPIQSTQSKSRTASSSSSSSHSDNPAQIVSFHNKNQELVVNYVPSSEASANNNADKQLIASLQAEIQHLNHDKLQYENEIQAYKRQQIQYQQQIAESDALLRDLRARESDATEILSAKESQINLLRVRLAESDEFLKKRTAQYQELQNEYSSLLQHSYNSPSSSSIEVLETHKTRVEQELERSRSEVERVSNENEQLIEQLKLTEKRLSDERLQLYEQQQQTKTAKSQINQLEYELNEYKSKAQRILQIKDNLITKLKDVIQHRNSIPTGGDQPELETSTNSDESVLPEGSLVSIPSVPLPTSSYWASIQYEELLSENELFKQELQTRESTIHNLRNELQEAELMIQHSDEQLREQTTQLKENLNEERSRLALVEQDYRKLKQDVISMTDDFNKQKQVYQRKLNEREQEIERLRSQITAKTINQVNDEELEKRLQTLTESLIQKQTIIEALQTDKSSLTMQLERLEKRLDDYETIAATSSVQQSSRANTTTAISLDDSEHYENLRYRMPLLRETPYDVDLTKKVKRAANELDKLGIRLTIFLRRYPAVRLGFLFYALLLHLWTFIVLFTYTPEAHGNINPINVKDKL